MQTFAFVVLLGLAAAAPVDEKVVITKDFYPESLVIYSSEHEIVKMTVPVNGINLRNDEEEDDEDRKILLFFVEAEKVDGKWEDRGLYVFRDDAPEKLLEGGRDAAAAYDDERDVYLAADDGIYWYNYDENTVEKYGSVTDSIIGIEKETDSDVIYILTEEHEVYKVTEEGTKKEKIVDYAEEIVVDYNNRLYFYGEDKQPYVFNENGLTKIEGIPEGAEEVKLLRPPVYAQDAVPFIVDEKSYVLYGSGYAEKFSFEFEADARPSAYAMEAGRMQYYAFEGKIYEFDLEDVVFGRIFDLIYEIFQSYIAMLKEILSLDIFNFN